MKNTFKSLAIALAVLSVAACKKENFKEAEPVQGNANTFICSFDTKAVAPNGVQTFVAGESIRLLNNEERTITDVTITEEMISNGGKTVMFSSDYPEDKPVLAIYSDASFSATSIWGSKEPYATKPHFSFGSSSLRNGYSVATAAAAEEGKGRILTFTNVLTCIKIASSKTASATNKWAYFMGNDNELIPNQMSVDPITGAVSIYPEDVSTIKTKFVSTNKTTDPTDIRVWILPGQEFKKGFKIIVGPNANADPVRVVDTPVTIPANSFINLGDVDKVITANCHIAKPGETVTIDTYKGNTNTLLDCDAASLIWQDNASLVKSVSFNSNKITVELNAAQEGNAVVAASKGGKVVWSWQIWVCNEDIKDVTIGSYTFMDRNVGATTIDEKSEKSIGVIFQYGRKDPFPGIKGYDTEKGAYVIRDIYNASGVAIAPEIKDNTEANNIENSIANPQTFYKNYYVSGQKHNYSWITTDCTTFDADLFKSLWENNGNKSEYDPCPAGYKVASIAAWEAVKAITPVEIWDNEYVTPDASVIGTNEKYIPGNKKKVQFRGCSYNGLKFTATGEVNANTTKDKFEFAIANCVGKALPTAEVWCADIDPDFPSKMSSSYFRGTAVKLNTTGNGNYEDISAIKVNPLSTAGKYGLNYALPVRCIKE